MSLDNWAAVHDVWPETREQRDWVHRMANVLDKLPKRLQAKAKQTLRQIRDAPTREAALEEIERFEEDFGDEGAGLEEARPDDGLQTAPDGRAAMEALEKRRTPAAHTRRSPLHRRREQVERNDHTNTERAAA